MGLAKRHRVKPGRRIDLSDIDTQVPSTLDREATEAKSRKDVRRLGDLQYRLYAASERSLLVVLQGPDASGKDGLIRHVFAGVNPQGVRVTPFGVPSEEEARHDFLWRVHHHAPAKGEIAVFNRSHYEGVLVERVHGLVTRSEWEERFELINAFEAGLVRSGTRILKFYLHISAEEQLERFRERLDDPAKHWKIDESDYTDRELWQAFETAANDMLSRTSTAIAPWFVIPSDHKWYRTFAVARIIRKALDDLDLRTPPAQVDIAEIRRKFHTAH